MESVAEFFSFALLWVGMMTLIGLALYITQRFRKTDDEKMVSGEEYAKNFEDKAAEKTPEKPIKKFFRNPYVLSDEEIAETKERVEE